MTDYELVEALAAVFRAVVTAPLGDCEVHEWDQVGYEEANGAVIISIEDGMQEHIAIGEQTQDQLTLNITGIVTHADAQANRRNVVDLREQIVEVLAANRTLAAGGDAARTNAREPLKWEYGPAAEGEQLRRRCTVQVVYEFNA